MQRVAGHTPGFSGVWFYMIGVGALHKCRALDADWECRMQFSNKVLKLSFNDFDHVSLKHSQVLFKGLKASPMMGWEQGTNTNRHVPNALIGACRLVFVPCTNYVAEAAGDLETWQIFDVVSGKGVRSKGVHWVTLEFR
jgi:hypothetical protein